MAIEVETKDCTALGDAELEEMEQLSADGLAKFALGGLSKQTDEWVLVTQAREKGKLKGFSFCTLERIGGTPAVLIGAAMITRTTKRDTVLRAMMTDQYRRAVLAFPDEDVIVGARLLDPAGYEAFASLDDLVPRPDHKASGEERAWGRRFAKRFGVANKAYRDREFRIVGDGETTYGLDHESLKPEKIANNFAEFFTDHNAADGDAIVAFGWATAEDLAKLAK